jgi:hypothetical protein
MALDRSALSPEERVELDSLLSSALNGSRNADPAAVDRAEAALVSAEQSGREWPSIVMRQAMRAQLQVELKSIAKDESMAMVDYQGRLIAKTLRRGVKRRNSDGSMSWQQALINEMSWPEFVNWIDMNAAQIEGLRVNQAMADQLLPLREKFPDSVGPGDACSRLGVSIEDYLTGEKIS